MDHVRSPKAVLTDIINYRYGAHRVRGDHPYMPALFQILDHVRQADDAWIQDMYVGNVEGLDTATATATWPDPPHVSGCPGAWYQRAMFQLAYLVGEGVLTRGEAFEMMLAMTSLNYNE